MKKQLPEGFRSWIQFYDYLNQTKPELFRFKTIRFMSYKPNDQQPTEDYSISIDTLKKYCWEELQGYRVSRELSHEAGSILHGNSTSKDMLPVIELLWKIEIIDFK